MRRSIVALVVAALLLSTPIAMGGSGGRRPKPPGYAAGTYNGTLAQKHPSTRRPLKISYTVTRRKTIVKIKFTILERCTDGSRLLVTDEIPGPVRIKRNRTFAYLVRYRDGSRALFKGSLKDKRGTGRVSADRDRNDAGASCAQQNEVKWAARRR